MNAATTVPELAEARIKAWSGVFHDDQGRVTGFWGLAISQMEHRFHAAGDDAPWAVIGP